ncbi:hypothetical protein PENTCL1PPCAC_767, partial [Pristionchus entomophagus]
GRMAPASDYLFLSIETVVNGLSMIAMIPCLSTLLRTQGMHGNCKVLLVTSAFVQSFLLCVQMALFAHNFITENLLPVNNEKEVPFLMVQNGFFITSSNLSMVLVLERTYAVWSAAHYERISRHIAPLIILIGGCLAAALANVYAIYWHGWFLEAAYILYGIEGFTLVVSILIIVYARRKFRSLPFDDDRLKAKYQVKEVLNFTSSLLPSVIVSVVMHTLSLVPSLLFYNQVIEWPLCCLVYFSAHSLSCIFTKLTLIACHKGMRQRFQLLFVERLGTPKGARIGKDAEKEGKEYFDQLKAAWNA